MSAPLRADIAAASWDSVIFDLGGDSLVRIPTLEPLRGSKAHVGALLDSVDSAVELVDQPHELVPVRFGRLGVAPAISPRPVGWRHFSHTGGGRWLRTDQAGRWWGDEDDDVQHRCGPEQGQEACRDTDDLLDGNRRRAGGRTPGTSCRHTSKRAASDLADQRSPGAAPLRRFIHDIRQPRRSPISAARRRSCCPAWDGCRGLETTCRTAPRSSR